MRVSEIHVKRIRVNQGLGVGIKLLSLGLKLGVEMSGVEMPRDLICY